MNREYSDEEIVEIVKAFKLYIKKIVNARSKQNNGNHDYHRPHHWHLRGLLSWQTDGGKDNKRGENTACGKSSGVGCRDGTG